MFARAKFVEALALLFADTSAILIAFERVVTLDTDFIIGIIASFIISVLVVEVILSIVAHRITCVFRASHLVSVSFLMSCKVAALGEPLVAVLVPAYVRLLSCMSAVVCAEVEIQRKLLSTNVSPERLFTLK
jgi:hypothetical protein